MARPFYYSVRMVRLDGTEQEYRFQKLIDARRDLATCQQAEEAVEIILEKVCFNEHRFEGPEKGHSPPEVRDLVDKKRKVADV